MEQNTENTYEAFFRNRQKKQDSAVLEAKKLVNLFRHLPVFGEHFISTYNQMLLNASPDAILNLTSLLGGVTVRNYLDFLKGQSGGEKPENQQGTYAVEEKSYLPPVVPKQPTTENSGANVSMTSAGVKEFLVAFAKEQQTAMKEMFQSLQEQVYKQAKDFSEDAKENAVPEIEGEEDIYHHFSSDPFSSIPKPPPFNKKG